MTSKKKKTPPRRKWQVWMRRRDIDGAIHYIPAVETDFGSFVDASEAASELNDLSNDRRVYYYPYRTKLEDTAK